MLCHIGCITIPLEILSKVGKGQRLSEKEGAISQSHPEAGGRLLAKVPRLELVSQMIAPSMQLDEFDRLTLGSHLLKLAVEIEDGIFRGLPKQAVLLELHANGCHPALLRAAEQIEFTASAKNCRTIPFPSPRLPNGPRCRRQWRNGHPFNSKGAALIRHPHRIPAAAAGIRRVRANGSRAASSRSACLNRQSFWSRLTIRSDPRLRSFAGTWQCNANSAVPILLLSVAFDVITSQSFGLRLSRDEYSSAPGSSPLESLARFNRDRAWHHLAARWIRRQPRRIPRRNSEMQRHAGLTDADLGLSATYYLAGCVAGALLFG